MRPHSRRAQELQTRPAMTLTIGIHTDGIPVISRHRGSLTVENALMGVGFHWQRRYPLRLKTERYALADGNDGIWLICETGLEDYLRSVVSSEMNPEAPEEFIKAHAIIARSWALRQVGARKPEGKEEKHRPCRPTILTHESKEIIRIFDGSDHSGFDLCNDDHCQRFQGEDAVTPRAEKAVKETEGLVLLDKHGKIADARYSKCCGGRTELFSTCWQDRDHDYLQSVNDPWCDLSRLPEEERQRILKSVMKDYDRTTTPNFLRWQRHVDASGIADRLSRDFHINIGSITNLRPIASGPSGRISRLEIQGTDGTTVIGKELAIRRLLADDCLLSSAFTAEKAEGGFLLHGRGWGHGVGLCQIGAAAMAAAGHSAEEILSHYYPGTRLSHFESAS